MPKTLLLADDSVTIQKVVGISFASEDIEITTVDNGKDAVAKARALRPDVILADVVMPGMSGYEVCEAIKADPNLSHVPVLLLTGTFEAFDEKRAAAAGAAGHVAKPFEAQTLVDRVKQLLAAAPAPRPPAPPPAVTARPVAAPQPGISARLSPAPPRAARDDAFDFFSDAPDEVATAAPVMPHADALDLDEPDAAFAFGDDDLASDVQEPLRAPPLPSTARRTGATAAILANAPASPPADDDAFDFSFEGEGTDALDEPVDPGQLGHATLLDPAAASGFDVSSSDLAAEFTRAPAAPTQILSFSREPLDADLDLTDPEPLDEAPLVLGEPMADTDDSDHHVRPFGAEPDPEDTIPRGPQGREAAAQRGEAERRWAPAETSREAAAQRGEAERRWAPAETSREAAAQRGEAERSVGPRGGSAVSIAVPAWPEAADPWEPEPVAEPTPPVPAPSAGSVLSPALRGELHDTLEKIAWDAFGQVTEKIVREAVERIERVAWEVVPKLAETLIQEEIRRLKGGSGEDR